MSPRAAYQKCTVCGVAYIGSANSKYCFRCRADLVRQKTITQYLQKRKSVKPYRKIGSTDICKKCGAEYIVKGGLQIHCEKCQQPQKKPSA